MSLWLIITKSLYTVLHIPPKWLQTKWEIFCWEINIFINAIPFLPVFPSCFSSVRNGWFSWDLSGQLDNLNVLCHIQTSLNFGRYDNPLPDKVNKSFLFHYIGIAKRNGKQDSLLQAKDHHDLHNLPKAVFLSRVQLLFPS